MAATFARTFRARPYLTSAAFTSVVGAAYYSTTQRPVLLDSAHNATQTFSFPKTMLFSQQLTVTGVEQVNHDTKRITFSLPGGKEETTGVPASAAILTQHTPPNAWFPVLRPYTPIHDRSDPGILQLLVKKYPSGVASSYMHSLVPGNQLTVRGPIPGYVWQPSPTPRSVLFVAGGAGITPIYSLAREALKDEQDRTRIHLLWGVNGERDIVLRDELAALQAQYPERLSVRYFVSSDDDGEKGAGSLATTVAQGEQSREKGYIDAGALRRAMQECESGGGGLGDAKGIKVFFCGPPGMQEKIVGKKGVLGELGVGKKEVYAW
ncbi:hypothetical protein KC343_g577 [Hortaea werneckii]|uniref:NADH-cytochrome b5 reductase n=1 Tax=Hortaea werneckii TaxID=91943 RepID=A0A3M7DJM8_HORWE|nr:hypothetical protein KC352_g10940 [Hortaea werneckii]KAI7569538.1 hypothetical protein KC317_g3243 [Hortaea werneckii]KAI7623328.1 hypothetical protein KC346_g2796 [Hortaea werneckii]KAI7637674.1 hypothetical protein KC343_g577 [Hortaea werneckii]KAI7682424.1 hypothetical protein KC319_g1021 [Hortaea werneckii]